ncbi:MAG: DUF2520 domain-containing protein [Eubacteriales bacterium]
MKIGFIGASKVGCSLGKYFKEYNSLCVSGYFSRTANNAKDASEFTQTTYFDTISDVVLNSDMIFITVSDSYIKDVWDEMKQLEFNNKIFCHCSGVLSSEVFDNVEQYNSYGCSVHPMLAINSKYTSYHDLKNAFFTLEGDKTEVLEELFIENNTAVIRADQKSKYHASAVFASNLVLSVLTMSTDLIEQCGFTAEQATQALNPIIENNIHNYLREGIHKALTGPVARNDVQTVATHIAALSGDELEVYRILTKKLMLIPKHDFTNMKKELEDKT